MKRTFLYSILYILLCLSCEKAPEYGTQLSLEIDMEHFLNNLAGNAADKEFQEVAHEAALEGQMKGESAIHLFRKAMQVRGKALAPYFVQKDRDLKYSSTDEEVVTWLEEEMSHSLRQYMELIERRAEAYGDHHLEFISDAGSVSLEMKVYQQVDYHVPAHYCTASNQLAFWEVPSTGADLLSRVNTKVIELEQPEPYDLSDTLSFGPSAEQKRAQFQQENPFMGLLDWSIPRLGQGPPIAYASAKDTAQVQAYLLRPEVQAIIGDIQFKWMWKAETEPWEAIGLVAVAPSSEGKPLLDGSVISLARMEFDPVSAEPFVYLDMNEEGARIFQRFTRNHIGGFLAIEFNGKILTTPRIQSEISGGRTNISGGFYAEEAKELAISINSGTLPLKMLVISAQIFGEVPEQAAAPE